MEGVKSLTQTGNIFNIQRFTIHDGPGLRTELFLKGCPLRCKWCSNPESFMTFSQPGVYRTKCISEEKCGECKEVCSGENVLQFFEGKIGAIDRQKCKHCLACADACPAEAIKQWGKYMTVEQCMEIIRKDRGYYDRSGGGVTVSGGDPLLQSDFVQQLFKACKEDGIQTCLESTFYAEWEDVLKVLPYTDLIISDLKHMNTEKHKQYTGVNNEKILENLKHLAREGRDMILRIPVIPDVNDDDINMKETADFILNELDGHVRTLQLLSFMRLGEEKYISLGIPYRMEDVELDREEFQKKVEKICAYFNDRNIHCLVETKEKE